VSLAALYESEGIFLPSCAEVSYHGGMTPSPHRVARIEMFEQTTRAFQTAVARVFFPLLLSRV